jgi:hypothetical protein
MSFWFRKVGAGNGSFKAAGPGGMPGRARAEVWNFPVPVVWFISRRVGRQRSRVLVTRVRLRQQGRGATLFTATDPGLYLIDDSHKEVVAGTSSQEWLPQGLAMPTVASDPFGRYALALGPFRVLEAPYSSFTPDPRVGPIRHEAETLETWFTASLLPDITWPPASTIWI